MNYQLWFFYTPVGGTANTRALVFHYHPSHFKQNRKPKITGPITVNAGAATQGKISDMPVLLTGGDTSYALGKVFIEDRGYVDNAVTGTPNVSGFNVQTREMYHAGIGRGVRVNTSFVRHRADSTSTVKVTPRARFGAEAWATIANDDASTGKTFTTTNGGAAQLAFSFGAESMDFTLTEPATVGANQIRLLGIGLEMVGTQQAKEEQLVLDEQIRQAKEIQEGMNPLRLLDKPEYQVKGFTRAAKGVGGDYFDFQVLPDKRLALLISDVSGKSISASLVMVLIKTVVSTYLQLFQNIKSNKILTTINRVMSSQAHIDKFATMLFIIFDPKTGLAEFTNVGQGPLFVYRAEAKTCTLTKLPGLPLGVDDENDRDRQVSLARSGGP